MNSCGELRMRNHEITVGHPLLSEKGRLAEPGWSRIFLQTYERKKVAAKSFRIKEWDYYLVMGKDFGAAFTISDNGYIGLQSISFLDFKKPFEHTKTVLAPLTMGKLHMPESPLTGSCFYNDKKLFMQFQNLPEERRIHCHFQKFYEKKPFKCEIVLKKMDMDSMNIAIPWEKNKKAFYYNHKCNCMRAEGYMEFNGRRYEFNPETDFATLDWGRGVWTYDNSWFWGNGNGIVEGKPFGFNIGYGFGDNSAATENILYYDGVGHKLDDVFFEIPEESFMDMWRFTSSDGRFEMDFKPVMDRKARLSLGVVKTDQHQVFGRMTGKAILDDGTVLELKDFLCFAEFVHNRY